MINMKLWAGLYPNIEKKKRISNYNSSFKREVMDENNMIELDQ